MKLKKIFSACELEQYYLTVTIKVNETLCMRICNHYKIKRSGIDMLQHRVDEVK